MLDDAEDVAPGGAESRADGRAPQVHHPEALEALGQAPAVPGEGLGPGAAAATEGGEHRVLQLGASDLHHVRPIPLLDLEGADEFHDLLLELAQGFDEGQPQGRGVGVVRRLVTVQVVVGREGSPRTGRLAEELEGPVAEHLVHRHVRGRSRAALEGVPRDGVDELAPHELLAGGDDGGEALLAPGGELVVASRRGELHGAEGPEQPGMDGAQGDGKVLRGAESVDAVEGVDGEFPFAQQILFPSGLAHRRPPFRQK